MSILSDVSATLDKALRIIAAQSPEARAALCRQQQRQAIATAAYEGTAEQRAAMKAARATGDSELIAIEAELALRRVAAALQAHDAVFGGDDEDEAQRASGGAPVKSEGVGI